MWKPRWLLTLALPLALAWGGTAAASSVRDQAGMFGAEAVRKAETELTRIERETQVVTTIETVNSLEGNTISEVTLRHAQNSGTQGLYVLIAKREGKIEALASKDYRQSLDTTRRKAIEKAFGSEFRNKEFDAGLLAGVKKIDDEISEAKSQFGSLRQAAAQAGRIGGRRGVPNPRGGVGLGSLIGIGLFILAVLFVFRLIGSLFGGGMARNRGGMMGGPGYGPGYGGGGGGIFSSILGGLGGAVAGNWLYDQFSGRHHGGGYTDSSTFGGDETGQSAGGDWGGGSTGGSDWSGGDGGGGGGGDWGGGGGGGDWGGGGGGGDW